jgi:hypothetical protein
MVGLPARNRSMKIEKSDWHSIQLKGCHSVLAVGNAEAFA